MPHRRLVLVLALAIGLAVLAAVAFMIPRPSREKPSHRDLTSSTTAMTVRVYEGPSSDVVRQQEWTEVATAVRSDSDGRWYDEAIRQDNERRWTAAAAKTRAPSPSTSTPTVVSGSGDVDAAIRSHFGSIADQAFRVANCESTLDPGAVSPGGGNWGLFQINTTWTDEFAAVTGVSWSAGVLNADTNAQFARWLYDRSGWRPWACSWAA